MSNKDYDDKYVAKDQDAYFIYLFIAVIVFILIAFFALRTLKSDAGVCLSNPSVQLIKTLEESSNSKVSCMCSFSNPLIKPIIISRSGNMTLR